jgi:vanillate O-demethylase monooxygenase subunit
VWNWIWIWPGDPALADPALIPDHDGLKLTSEGWNSSADFAKHWPGNYLLQVENSSDNLHLNFIHEGLVDDGLIGSILPSVEQNGHVVITTAEIPNTSGVELEKWWGFQIDPDCTRDRKVVTETHCPSVGHFKWTVVPHTADSRGDPQTMAATLAITPETDNSHWVFYASSINFEPRVAPDGESHIETLQKVLTQDVDCFVAIQDVVDKFGTVGTDISVPSDERALRARRVIGRMLAAEQGESSVKERAAQGEGRLTPVQR